jgi:hypothetical protein
VKHEKLEEAMKLFCQQAIANNLPLTGPIIKEKALELAKKINIQNFAGSNGWLSKFTKRNDLTWKTMSGESAAVDISISDNYKKLYFANFVTQL